MTGFTIIGNRGYGKTFLATSIAQQAARKNIPTVYITAKGDHWDPWIAQHGPYPTVSNARRVDLLDGPSGVLNPFTIPFPDMSERDRQRIAREVLRMVIGPDVDTRSERQDWLLEQAVKVVSESYAYPCLGHVMLVLFAIADGRLLEEIMPWSPSDRTTAWKVTAEEEAFRRSEEEAWKVTAEALARRLHEVERKPGAHVLFGHTTPFTELIPSDGVTFLNLSPIALDPSPLGGALMMMATQYAIGAMAAAPSPQTLVIVDDTAVILDDPERDHYSNERAKDSLSSLVSLGGWYGVSVGVVANNVFDVTPVSRQDGPYNAKCYGTSIYVGPFHSWDRRVIAELTGLGDASAEHLYTAKAKRGQFLMSTVTDAYLTPEKMIRVEREATFGRLLVDGPNDGRGYFIIEEVADGKFRLNSLTRQAGR